MEKVSNTTSSRKTFTDYLRLWFKWFLDPIAGFLNRLGLTPNMVTGLGLLGNIVGAVYLARGELLTGGIWIALMTPVDALDGTMARLRGLDPAIRVSNVENRIPLRRPEDLAKLAEGLQLAGLPE